MIENLIFLTFKNFLSVNELKDLFENCGHHCDFLRLHL